MSHTENILKMLPDRINQRNDLMVTPPWIAKDMINLLPEEVWNKNSTFLDPACKSGIFLHEIYLKLMETPAMIQEFPDNAERRKHILQNQLFGIALNPMCQLMSARTVYGTIQGENNIILIDNYINIIKNKDTKFFKEAIKEQFGEMKFNVVIGNPPYNDTDETGSSKSINTLFVDKAINLNAKYITYIMPDRWFLSPDKLNAHCRESLVGKIKYLRDFNDNEIPFEGVSIAGGVSYFLYDRDYDGEMKYVDSTGEVNVRHNSKLMCKSCRGNMLYNNVKNIATGYMDAEWISTSFFGLTRSARGHITKTDENNITLKSSGNDTYMSLSDIPRNGQYAQYYKVAIPYSAMEPEPFILMPNEICTLTYLIIGIFKTIEEAQSCEKYFRTNFVKILFSAVKTKLGTTKENLMCIPLQDFKPINLQTCTDKEKIDWSQSISNIDQQLYKKYNLTEEEIAYIEKTIKPMQ